MPQTTVNTVLAPLASGMLADASPKLVDTFTNSDTVNLPFGVMVAQGAAYGQALAVVAGSTAATMVGVVINSQNFDPGSNGQLVQGGSNPGLVPGTVMSILSKGRINVLVDTAVTIGQQAYVRVVANGGIKTQLGAFGGSADTATAVQVKGARFLTAASAGGVATLELDINAAQARL